MWLFVRDLFGLLYAKRKLWLVPVLVVVLGVGLVTFLAQASPLGPLIYTLF